MTWTDFYIQSIYCSVITGNPTIVLRLYRVWWVSLVIVYNFWKKKTAFLTRVAFLIRFIFLNRWQRIVEFAVGINDSAIVTQSSSTVDDNNNIVLSLAVKQIKLETKQTYATPLSINKHCCIRFSVLVDLPGWFSNLIYTRWPSFIWQAVLN